MKIDTSLATKRKKSTIIKEGQEKPKAKRESYYVDNIRFCKELVEWQELCKVYDEEGKKRIQAPAYVGYAILNICRGLSMLHYFARYTYNDEMVGNAIENCVAKLHNFNPQKTSNPFSYFTQVAYYSFIGTIAKEKKIAYDRYKMTLDKLIIGDYANNSDQSNEILSHILDNPELQVDYLEDYIKTYEDKNKVKSDKLKKKQQDKEDKSRGVFDETGSA